MKKARPALGVMACGVMYASMWLLPYIKYVFYDAIVEATGFTNTQIGFTLSVYIISCIICTFPSGWLADKFDPKRLLIMSGIAHTVFSFLALFFITNYVMTLICFFMLGVSSMLGFWSPVFKAVSMSCRKEDQSKYLGLFSCFDGVGSMIYAFGALAVYGMITGGTVAALKAVYIFYALATLVSTLLVAFLYKPSMEAEVEESSTSAKKPTTKEIFSVLKMPKVWAFSLMVMGVYGFYCGSSYLTPYFSTVLGVSIVFSGGVAILKNYGTRMVGAPVAGIICDKIGRLKFLTIGSAVSLVLMIAFMMMPADINALVPIMILMFTLALVNVSVKSVEFSALNEVGVDQSVNGMAVAVATLIGHNLPDVALHPIFGAILDHNEPVAAYKIIFICLLSLLVIALITSYTLCRSHKKELKAAASNS